jgi:hypothetical protein
MPFNPQTGQWEYSYGQTRPGPEQHPGSYTPIPRTPGFNNPNYDAQRQAQLGGQGSFQPTPPEYNGGGDQSIGATNRMGMPGNMDYFGGGGGGGQNTNWDFSKLAQAPGYGQYDMNGNPNPSVYPTGGATQGPDLFNHPAPVATALAPAPPPPQAQAGGQIPWWQMALEDPNGPYANRQAGDYGPTGAPNFVLNPQTQQEWVDRYNWFGQNQGALLNPTAPHPMQAQTQQGPVVPWQQFKSNVYADTNAQRSFNELSGVVDDARLAQAQDLYGWQNGPMGLPDATSALSQANALGDAHPEFDYQIVRTASGGYGIMAREKSQQAQQARDFFAPGQRPAPPPPPPAPSRSGGGYQNQTPRRVSNSYSSSGKGKGGGGSGGGSGGGGAKGADPALAQRQKELGGFLGKVGGALANTVTHPAPAVQHPVQDTMGMIHRAMEAAKQAAGQQAPAQNPVAGASNIINTGLNTILHPYEGQVIPDGHGGSLVFMGGQWRAGRG